MALSQGMISCLPACTAMSFKVLPEMALPFTTWFSPERTMPFLPEAVITLLVTVFLAVPEAI